MDNLIRTALTRASDVQRIYKEISGSIKEDSWLPVTVVCQTCRKLRTTRTFDFDGETVGYACDQNPDNTKACGHTGRIAPWAGNAKLHWKVDWAAKWGALGVDIEGAGKDHSTKGGARDVANHIARELFGYEPPYNIPYEFFLVGGKKMSSSKGRGSSAKEVADLFPSEVFRLALIGKDINQAINFEPEGDSVPRWYDWHDELADMVRRGIADDFTRLYALTELPENRAESSAPWQMRFRELAFVLQMPHLSLSEEAARAKGLPAGRQESPLTEEESAALVERAEYAKFWLATYAPPEFRYELQKTLPSVSLSDTQKKALRELLLYIVVPRTGEEIHARLHELKAEVPIEPKELFAALYRIFLNRDSGPKVGWFLSVLPRDFLLERLQNASL